MTATRFNVSGLADLGRELAKLKGDVAGRIGRGATLAAAQVVRKEAARRAPKLTGVGAKGIVTKRERQTSLTAEYQVGYRKVRKADKNGPKDGWYMRLQEFGTVKMAAQPHMRPAFEAKKVEAVDKMAAVLRRRIDKAAGK